MCAVSLTCSIGEHSCAMAHTAGWRGRCPLPHAPPLSIRMTIVGALPPHPRSCGGPHTLTFIPRKAWGRVTDTPPRCVGTNVRQVHRAPCIATATAPACTPFSYIIKQHSMQQNAPLHPTIEKSHENTLSRERQEREHGSLRYHYERIRRISHTCTAAARKQLRTRREYPLST